MNTSAPLGTPHRQFTLGGDSPREHIKEPTYTDTPPEPHAHQWPGDWTGFCTADEAHRITSRDEAGALTLSGELGGPTLLTRLAYIGHATSSGRRGNLLDQLAQIEDQHAWAAIVKTAFIAAYQEARARWEAEHAAITHAERIPGPVLRVIRETMGLTPEQMAQRLALSPRTLLGWEAGKPTINAGASREVWDLWVEWVEHVRAQMGSGEVPVLPADSPAWLIRAALLIQGGEPVTLNPGPLTTASWMEA